MPFIHTRMNRPLSKEKEQALSQALGKAIELIPGKTENWLMLQFEDNCRLWFRGENENPMAMVQVQVFGNLRMTAPRSNDERLHFCAVKP